MEKKVGRRVNVKSKDLTPEMLTPEMTPETCDPRDKSAKDGHFFGSGRLSCISFNRLDCAFGTIRTCWRPKVLTSC
jgi:hypothetical protein